MIQQIASANILHTVIAAIQDAKKEVLATDNEEGVTKNLKYAKTLKQLQENGVIFKRQQFSGKALTSKSPYLRMILIDDTLLFFAIPTINEPTFFSTDEKELIEAYKKYFLSIKSRPETTSSKSTD